MGDGLHVLCALCWTPRCVRDGTCCWNCERCGRCTGREAWGVWCVDCGVGDGRAGRGRREEEQGAVVAGLWLGRRLEKDLVKSEPLAGELYKAGIVGGGMGKRKLEDNVRTCGKCMGIIGFEDGGRDTCCCG